MQEDGTFDVLPKKEVIALKKEMDKLQKNLGGIKEMKKTAGCYLRRRPEEGKNLRTGSSYTGYSAYRYLLIPTVIRKSSIM